MKRFRREDGEDGAAGAWIAAAIALVFVAAGLAVGRVALQPKSGDEGVRSAKEAKPAPEIEGIDRWFNAQPIELRALRGKVVVIDFWAFSCVNCVRTIPTLRALYERYKPFGLEIVGVHSPEFDFERQPANVRDAIARLGVTWPVAMDNDFVTWQAYGNHYWPHVYFVDRAGRIRYDHVGEGDEAEQETELRKLLAEGGRTLPGPVSAKEPSFDPHLTPEIYAGTDRGIAAGTIANKEGYGSGAIRYRAPPFGDIAGAAPDGRIYLDGSWTATPETLRANGSARVHLPFNARTVFMVASSSPQSDVVLKIDGVPLGSLAATDDVVRVGRSDLYALVELTQTERHVLTLEVTRGFSLYTFTFG